MPKHKKNREQKKKADERNSTFVNSSIHSHSFTQPSYAFRTTGTIANASQNMREHTNTRVLIRHDLTKTLIVSASIVFLQLLFYFLLKNHVLAINFVSY